MTDKLPDNANELVAKVCEFTKNADSPFGGRYEEYRHGTIPFLPATDPAAALKAADAYAMLTGWDIHINILGESNSIFDGLFEVCVDEQSAHYDDDFCQAVCAMILAAEEARTK